MSEITQQIDLAITVLSPLHIGSGRELLQDYDIVPHDGRTWRIREDALLEAALGGGTDLDEALLGRPASELLQPSDFEGHPEFFRYVIGGVPSAGTQGARVSEHIKDVFDRPYLPGSSLKGALRTLLLWGGYWDDGLALNVRRLGRDARRASRPLEKQVFGSSPNEDWLRALRVRDSEPVGAQDHLAVQTVRVYPTADSRSSGLDVDVEAIEPGTTLRAALTLETYGFEAAEAAGLRWRGKRRWLRDLAGLAKQHAGTRLMTEAQYFKEHGGPQGAMRFYDELIKRLLESSDDVLFLQLGWGAGWESKTLGSSVLQGDAQQFEDLLSRYRVTKERARQPGDPFPRSRKLALANGRPVLPMGWVAVRVSGLEAIDVSQPPSREEELAGQRKGSLKRFFDDRGFGFIQPDGGGDDIFVHVSGLVDPAAALREGQRLSFEVEQTAKGTRAVNVRILD